MLERVRCEGAYATRVRAEEAVRPVLGGLGRQLTGGERAGLAACLPFEAALTLTAQLPDTRPVTGRGFVRDLADRSSAAPATARWDAGTVFAAVTALAGPGLITRVLDRLPAGYALLFGQAEPRYLQSAAA